MLDGRLQLFCQNLGHLPSLHLRSHGLDLGTLLERANEGDPLANGIIAEAGEHLGVAVANLLNLLNPGRVVLGGGLESLGGLGGLSGRGKRRGSGDSGAAG